MALNTSLVGFTLSQGNDTQWGKVTGIESTKITFQLPFKTTNYIAVPGIEWNADSVYASVITNKTVNTITIYISDSRSIARTYIAIGK